MLDSWESLRAKPLSERYTLALEMLGLLGLVESQKAVQQVQDFGMDRPYPDKLMSYGGSESVTQPLRPLGKRGKR